MPNFTKPKVSSVNALLFDALITKDEGKFAEGLETLRPKAKRLISEYNIGSWNAQELLMNAEEKALDEFRKASAQHIRNPENYYLTVIHNAIVDELESGAIPDNLSTSELRFESIGPNRADQVMGAVTLIEGKAPGEDEDFQETIGLHEVKLRKKRKKEPVLYDPHPQLRNLREIVESTGWKTKTQNIRKMQKTYRSSKLLVDTVPSTTGIGPEILKRYFYGYRQVEIASQLGLPKSNVSRTIKTWAVERWNWDEGKIILVINSWLAQSLKNISLRVKKDIKYNHNPGSPNMEIQQALNNRNKEIELAKGMAMRAKKLESEGYAKSLVGKKLVREGWPSYRVREYLDSNGISWWIDEASWDLERASKRLGYTIDQIMWGTWKPELWERYMNELLAKATNSLETAAHFRDLREDDKIWLLDVVWCLEKH